jgi:DNA-binding CsgD family transcriptional regulator
LDLFSQRYYRGLQIHDELRRDLGFDHQVAFSIPIDRHRRICVTINRHGRDFSKSEVDRLEALRRPVAACASRIALMERFDLPGTSATSRLTPRERDVLTLVATGLSNVQIGLRLGISARTVNKHLEHIFTKTGLSNRTQIAACWPRIGRQRWEPAGPET